MRTARGAPHGRAFFVAVLVVLVGAVLAGTAGAARAAPDDSGGWMRPVDGPVVRPFDAPSSEYAAGHRGVDFAAAPGTPVRAAGDGVVSFAGSVAGTLHVTLAHDGDLRTSYSFLSSVGVRLGQPVTRGDVVGLAGGAGTDHDGRVLHLGLRIGDRYVDPMLLFRPRDLTELVRLVPAGEPAETPWSPAGERRALQSSLHLPTPRGDLDRTATTSDDSCDSGVPLLGGAIDAACDLGTWVGEGADAAVDAGLRFLDATTGLGTEALAGLRTTVEATVSSMRALSSELAAALAHTPAGMLALDVVTIGRRFADTVTADCSDDASDADGTGGSAHRVMVVAGIDSAGKAWDRGPTVALDVKALGYHADEGEVRYYSYAADGGAYTAADTHGPIEVDALHLAEQLRAMQREQPGREVDLIAHSQGGIVVDEFLSHVYRAGDRTLPPLGNVVTLSSPHEGAPLATAGRRIRATTLGRAALDAIEDVSSLPPPSSPAVQELAEGSPLLDHLWDQGVPEHFDMTTIGATEDVVVPATNISVPGATETVAAVNGLSEHSAIVRAPDALRAVRAALEGRPPPCVSLLTALRSAVAPVVISRVSHEFGDAAAKILGGAG
jgi:Peptidase family M23